MIHYACEFDQSHFLAKIRRYQGSRFLLEQLKLKSKSGKTPIHILALTANSKLLGNVLNFIYKQGDKELFDSLAKNKDSKEGSLPVHMLLMNNRNNDQSLILKAFRVIHKYWSLV